MGLKFRKRITVFPGFKINLSKSGISSTIGIKGLSLNLNKTGGYLNLGLPGSGLYDRIKLDGNKSNKKNGGGSEITYESIEILGDEIKSLDIGKMSDEVGEQLKSDIKESNKQRNDLKFDILIINIKVILLGFIYFIMFGFMIKKFKTYFNDSKKLLVEIKYIYSKVGVDLDISFDSEAKSLFIDLKESFKVLQGSNKVWDVTSTKQNNGSADRSGASNVITRKETSISNKELEFINTQDSGFMFTNKNGGDIYIYPGHIIIKKGEDLDIFDIGKLNIDYYENRFIEEEKVCKDTEILDYTWKYVNKSGNPDKRYSDNREIPVVNYGNIVFTSNTGLCDEFSFSSSEKLMDFGYKLESYLNYIGNNSGRNAVKHINNVDENSYENDDNIDIDYYTIVSETGKTLNTQQNNTIINDIEKDREDIYNKYGELSLEVEELKIKNELASMIDFEAKIHNTFSEDILKNSIGKGLLVSTDPLRTKIEYEDNYIDTYKYIGKKVKNVKFNEIKKSLDNSKLQSLNMHSNYIYDLYAKSLRKVGNYYKKGKNWKEAKSCFLIIEDIGFAGINDKKSLIKINAELLKI